MRGCFRTGCAVQFTGDCITLLVFHLNRRSLSSLRPRAIPIAPRPAQFRANVATISNSATIALLRTSEATFV